VQRQYSGTAGRVENCQLGVFLAYATGKGRALVDRELYLPKSWTDDRDRCRDAAVPDDVQFAAKPELARVMLGRALDAGLPAAWVTADEAYGRDGKFRAWLEQRRVGYVVAVDSRQAIAGDAGTSRAGALAAHAPDRAWKRRSCGNGSMGPRVFDWASATLPADGTEPPGWLRRPRRGHGDRARRPAHRRCAAVPARCAAARYPRRPRRRPPRRTAPGR
jgi:SRSO17 transposase